MKIQNVFGILLLSTSIVVAHEALKEEATKNLGTMPASFYTNGKKFVDTTFSGQSWKVLISQGKVPYHHLVASDFRVDDQVQSKSDVYTMGFVKYQYNAQSFPIGRDRWKAVIIQFGVASGLDHNKTWRRSHQVDPSVYLRHEQGHLDINELSARTFAGHVAKEKPEGIGVSEAEALSDLDRKLKAIFAKIETQNSNEQEAYDRRCSSGWDQVEQTKLTSELSVKISQASIVAVWQPPVARGSDISGVIQPEVIY